MTAPKNSPCRFGLMRHAQTEWNLAKRIQGRHDSPLTAAGKRQARNWGRLLKRFHWDRILSSDAGRARNTANLVNAYLKAPLEVDPRLQEQDWGAWTGYLEADIRRDYARQLTELTARGWDFCPPGGESRRAVWRRSHAALLEAAAAWPGATLLVVTHEGIIKSLCYHLSGRRFLPDEPPLIRPGHLHRLACRANRSELQIEQLNALALF